MFSREPVVFFSVLDYHVADNSFIVQFATAALKSPHKIRPESQTKCIAKIGRVYHANTQVVTVADCYNMWRKLCWK